MAQLGARVNGIHEVTGSIPVWSTILRSPFGRASDGKPSRSESPHQRRMVSSVARSAKEDRSHFVASLVLRSAQRKGGLTFGWQALAGSPSQAKDGGPFARPRVSELRVVATPHEFTTQIRDSPDAPQCRVRVNTG